MVDKVRRFSNQELTNLFQTIGDLLEIKGESIYKILAYRKAADSLNELGRDIYAIWEDGALQQIPGVGKAIAAKLDELLATGELEFYKKLTSEIPESLASLLQVPDLGPKKVALFWRSLGITTLAELEEAARSGKLSQLPGVGAKSEARVLAGIAALSQRTKRIPLSRAWPFAQELLAYLEQLPAVVKAEVAGSLRRMRETVGDLDILVAAHESAPVMDAFVAHPLVSRVLAHGKIKSSVSFSQGIQAQLWVHPPERYGTALQYATGSQAHNVRLRELALGQGFSLSEHALSRDDGTELLCASEDEVYETLGLPWIPPELREDRGEIEAAREGRLPALVELGDIKSELHCHSTWSDGKLSVLEMAQAVQRRGMSLVVITDHSESLGVAGGLSPAELREQRAEIEEARHIIGGDFTILQGAEIEIKADGSLDYADDVLAQLDLVCASLHTGLRQSRERVTKRLLRAIENPHVDMIGHPTGRLIPNREPADLDMDAILDAAAEHDVILEVNAHPARLDLNDVFIRRALELGVKISINTDAHAESDLDLLHFGVSTARRGWATAEQVVNTWPPDRLITWLRRRG